MDNPQIMLADLFLALGQSPAARPTWLDFAELGAVIVAVIALIVAIGQMRATVRSTNLLATQLRYTTHSERVSRTFEFMKRYNDPSFMELRTPVLDFLRKHGQSFSELQSKLDSDPEFRGSFLLILNFLEELGLAWNTHSIHEQVCMDFFATLVRKWYDHYATWITDQRGKENNERLWRQFTRMRDSLIDRLEGKSPGLQIVARGLYPPE